MYRQSRMAAPISPAERYALGQARRKQLRRQEHGHWRSPLSRSPVTTIARSMRGRIPSLATLKYERMLASPFGFFRGAVPVMAADLAALPNTGILSQICGDAHVSNLGAYAAPDGRLIFDINDFDETCAAPFEWDLKRMATSLVLAGRQNGQKRPRLPRSRPHSRPELSQTGRYSRAHFSGGSGALPGASAGAGDTGIRSAA